MRDSERLDLPSASGFSRVADCPGSENLIRTLPIEEPFIDVIEPTEEEEETDEDKAMADRGTRLHKAWETDDFAILNDEEELQDYQRGTKFREEAINAWLQSIGKSSFVTKREERLWLHDEKTCAPVTSAKLDYFAIADNEGLVLDYKSGWNKNLTPSDINWQLRVAAVVLKKEYPELTRIRVGFIKPKGMNIPDFTDYGEQDIAFAERDIRFRLWRAKQPDATRNPGAHCRWCPAKAFCREAAAMSLLPSISSVTAPVALDASKEGIETLVSLMSPSDLAAIQKRVSIINSIIKSVTSRLKTFTPEQLEEIGLGFGKPRTTRSISNAKAAFEHLRDTYGIKEDELWQALKFGNTALVDALRRDQGWPKTKTDGFVKQLAESHGTVKEGEPPIVPI